MARKGAILSAVDLVRGVGMLLGWTRIDVPGATGYLDTDYAAKGRYGVEALKNHDLVCVHVEAPDEASHEGKADAKVKALEQIDGTSSALCSKRCRSMAPGASSSRPTTAPRCARGPMLMGRSPSPWRARAFAASGQASYDEAVAAAGELCL